MDKDYRKELWIYSILVIIATIASGITGLLWNWDVNSVLNTVIAIAGFLIFFYATVRFAIALELKPRQWLAAIGLMLLFYVGSILYMTTRQPPQVVPGTE